MAIGTTQFTLNGSVVDSFSYLLTLPKPEWIIPYRIRLDSARNLNVVDYGDPFSTAKGNVIWKMDTRGIITLSAGTGWKGEAGDGEMATKANLGRIEDLWFDRQGNLYIADGFEGRIRKVSISGIITTVAGSGEEKGGGMATKTRLRNPEGVCVDAEGGIFITDSYEEKIYKVDSAGIIWTVAGTGQLGYSGDGGPAVEARLFSPTSPRLSADGTIYFIDAGNKVVRKLYLP
jgi:hypothetical protein